MMKKYEKVEEVKIKRKKIENKSILIIIINYNTK